MTPRPTLTPRVVRGLRAVTYWARTDMANGRLLTYAAMGSDVNAALEYIHDTLAAWEHSKKLLAREGTPLPEGDG